MALYTDLPGSSAVTFRAAADYIYTTSSSSSAANAVPVNVQALLCFGWNDAQQYWLCKNSFGPAWGQPGGALKIAYGAAFVMQSKYTFGVEFTVDNHPRRALQTLRTNTVPDPTQPKCYLYTPPQPTRIIQLAADISAAWTELNRTGASQQQPTWRQILEQLLVNNAPAAAEAVLANFAEYTHQQYLDGGSRRNGLGSSGADDGGSDGRSTDTWLTSAILGVLTELRGPSTDQPFKLCGVCASGWLWCTSKMSFYQF
jgi:hypothetical protein